MGSGTTHDLDKVPILLGGVGVTLDVADDLAVGLGGGVEAKGALDVLVLQVAVDGLGAADDLDAAVVGGKILGKDCGVGVGVAHLFFQDFIFRHLAVEIYHLRLIEFI